MEEMFRWSGAEPEEIGTVLDVGCGFGGTSRLLASKLPSASVKGITLSPEQVRRGTELAKEKGLGNVSFEVMDALKMDFPDNSFDMVWACESGEHMPDKKAYVDEMVRVLKPGGTIVIATWCQRETPPAFAPEEKQRLQFLYDEWSHPHFISIEEYVRLMEATGDLEVRKPTSVIVLPLLPFAFVDTQAIDRSINRTSMSRVGPRLAQIQFDPAKPRAPNTPHVDASSSPPRLLAERRLGQLERSDDPKLAAFDLGWRLGPMDRREEGAQSVVRRRTLCAASRHNGGGTTIG